MLHKHAALGLLLWGTNLLASLFSAWAAFCHFFFQCFPFYGTHVKASAAPAEEGRTGALWEDGGQQGGMGG